jgi:hypothetical protein
MAIRIKSNKPSNTILEQSHEKIGKESISWANTFYKIGRIYKKQGLHEKGK